MSVASGSLISHQISRSSSPTAVRVGVVALGVAVTAAAAQVSFPIPFTTVPFTLTPMAVLLVGAALGSRLGFITQAVYLALGALGAQVFSPSVLLPPGAARLMGPTAGYLWAYPIAAFLTGWLAERGWDRAYFTSFAAMAVGLLVIFTGGVSWMAASITHSIPAAIATGFTPFVLADLIKLACASMILPQVWRVVHFENTNKY